MTCDLKTALCTTVHLAAKTATSQLVTWSSRHTVMSSQVNSSQARFFSHSQVVTRSSRHKPTLYKATGKGPKFSGHADINGHYQRAKFGCPRPLRGDSRRGDKCFSLTPPPSKFSCQIFKIFSYLLTTIRPTNGEKYRKIVGSVFRKL